MDKVVIRRHRHRRHWTFIELVRIRGQRQIGKSVEDIAAKMGRTSKAVERRLSRGDNRMSVLGPGSRQGETE